MLRMVEPAGLRLLLAAFVTAMLAVGCGKGNVLESSTGPSSTLSSNAPISGDDSSATASKTGEANALAKGGNGHGKGGGHDAEEDKGPGRNHEDKVVGFVTAKNGDTLTVNGVSVTPGTNALIRHGHRVLTIGDVEVGDHVEARGAVDDGKLVATEIKVQDTGNNDGDDDGNDED
jgi:Domain of unknown function (DUF5666)